MKTLFPETVDKPAVAHAPNLESIIHAAKAGRLALMECEWKATGEKVGVIVALNPEGNEVAFVPFAMFFNGNPYEMLNPPIPEGGFERN